MTSRDFYLHDLNATCELAARLAPALKSGDVLALYGDLGAGKTEFARALLKTLGVQGDVPSPTFTLLQTYDVADLHISHYDLYRLKSSEELEELGWDDALAHDLVLVEWPERAGKRLPPKSLALRFSLDGENNRHCVIDAGDDWQIRLGVDF